MSYDYAKDRVKAAAALRRLCLGAEVVGVRWDFFPEEVSLYIDDTARARTDPTYRAYLAYTKTRPYGILGISIGSTWTILDQLPAADAEEEQAIAAGLGETLSEESLHHLMRLRTQPITTLRLGWRWRT